jgi:hypothetical protein
MDYGWTQWILKNSGGFVSTVFTDKEIQSEKLMESTLEDGRLQSVIVFPDQSSRAILNGHRSGTMPPEISGGLGDKGVAALRRFVENGGTLVFLNRASNFAIEQFKLPLRDVVAGLPRTDFYVPGSILRIELDTTHPLTAGMPKESIAWAEESPVFEVVDSNDPSAPKRSDVRVIARYPADKDPLLSGWLLGGNLIKGKAALVEVKMGGGKIVLFGFRPQYRAQSLATYPLFFNAIGGK